MTAPHVHAALIKIWADNPETKFQYESGDGWVNCNSDPTWNRWTVYRVKPDPYAELKAAFAAGSEIQYMDQNGRWRDCFPSWSPNTEYRIKPVPLVQYAAVFKTRGTGAIMVAPSYEDRKEAANPPWWDHQSEQFLNSVLKIEFEKDTGKLIFCTQEAP